MALKLSMIISILMSICWGTNTTVQAQTFSNPDTILGKWTNEDKTRTIEFTKNGASYEAVIKDAPDRNMIGTKQITGLQFDGKEYKNGEVHLPKRGKTFPCTVSLKSDGTMELSAKTGFMSKVQIWTRVKKT